MTTTYAWTAEDPPALDETLAPVHRPASGGLEGTLIDGVDWILTQVGLLDVLDHLTGDPDALHAAATHLLEQATAVRSVSLRLRRDAAPLAQTWHGEASAAFGAFMGECIAALDALSANLARTARVLNRAGIEAGIAQDLVTGIVADAAEWAAAELAATAVADLLTLGLAAMAGAIAESATLAVFVERAARAATEFGIALERLVQELHELKEAREAMRAADGFRKLQELRKTQAVLQELPMLGAVFTKAEAMVDVTIGLETGLPINAYGALPLTAAIARTLFEERQQIRRALQR